MIKKAAIIVLCVFAMVSMQAQNQPFYKQDFNSGKIPADWTISEAKGVWDPQWIVTNDPYPGSYKYQQQAPPIASKSRGAYMLFQAGYFTDEDVENWVKKNNYPDGWITSAPIDCSGKKIGCFKISTHVSLVGLSPG